MRMFVQTAKFESVCEISKMSRESLNVSGSESGKNDEYNFQTDDDWLAQSKHIFVLSLSGKPIFSRYGDENKLVTLFGVIQAIVSFINVQGHEDELQNITVGSHRFVFVRKSHFIMLLVSGANQEKWAESVRRLEDELHFIHDSIVSTFTMSQLDKIFRTQCNYDFRNAIGDPKKYFGRISRWTSTASFSFRTMQCLEMYAAVRQSVTDLWTQCCSKKKELVFGIILMGQKLVTIVRLKNFLLPLKDLHLIVNLVDMLRLEESFESWSPLCLTNFNSDGFLHCYAACLHKAYELTLVLLSTEKDAFYQCKQIRQTFEEKLLQTKNESLAVTSSLESVVSTSWLSFNFQKDFECLTESCDFDFDSLQYVFYKIEKSDYGFVEWTKNECDQNRLRAIATHLLDSIDDVTAAAAADSKGLKKTIFETDLQFHCFAHSTKQFKLIVIAKPVIDHKRFQDLIPKLLKLLKKNQDCYFFLNESNTFNC